MFSSQNVCHGDKTSFDHEGFSVHAKIVCDQDPDTSWIGEFSDTPGEGAIDHHATGIWLERSYRGPRYFNPANYSYDYYLNTEKRSKSEARSLANEQAKQDYKRLVGFYQGDWSMVGVVVTVYRDGVELGSASIWGIETDSGADCFKSLVMDELLHEAVNEARMTLDKLVAFAGGAK